MQRNTENKSTRQPLLSDSHSSSDTPHAKTKLNSPQVERLKRSYELLKQVKTALVLSIEPPLTQTEYSRRPSVDNADLSLSLQPLSHSLSLTPLTSTLTVASINTFESESPTSPRTIRFNLGDSKASASQSEIKSTQESKSEFKETAAIKFDIDYLKTNLMKRAGSMEEAALFYAKYFLLPHEQKDFENELNQLELVFKKSKPMALKNQFVKHRKKINAIIQKYHKQHSDNLIDTQKKRFPTKSPGLTMLESMKVSYNFSTDPIRTVTRLDKNLILIKTETPLFDLTDDQVNRYIKTANKPSSSKDSGAQFLARAIIQELKKIAGNDTEKLRSLIRRHLGHKTANLRSTGLATRMFWHTQVYDEQTKKIVYEASGERSPTPRPAPKIVRNSKLRDDITRENCEQALTNARYEAEKFHQKYNLPQQTKVPSFTAIQSYLSPNWFPYRVKEKDDDNNTDMFRSNKTALVEILKDTPPDRLIGNNIISSTDQAILLCRPINDARNKRLFLHTDYIQADEPTLIQLVSSRLILIASSDKLSAQEKEYCTHLQKTLEEINQPDVFNNHEKIVAAFQKHNLFNRIHILKNNDDPDSPSFTLKILTQSLYQLSLTRLGFNDCQGFNRQAILAGYTSTISNLTGILVVDGCKSAHDRRGLTGDTMNAMTAYIGKNKDTFPLFDYQNGDPLDKNYPNLDELADLYWKELCSGQSALVRGEHVPGSTGLKELEGNIHPRLLDKIKPVLEVINILADISKVGGKAGKDQDKKEEAQERKETTKEIRKTAKELPVSTLVREHQAKYGCSDKVEKYFLDAIYPWLDASQEQKVKSTLKQLSFLIPGSSGNGDFSEEETLQLLGLSNQRPSQRVFEIWLTLGEECFARGEEIAKECGIDISEKKNCYLKIINSAREHTAAPFIAPSLFEWLRHDSPRLSKASVFPRSKPLASQSAAIQGFFGYDKEMQKEITDPTAPLPFKWSDPFEKLFNLPCCGQRLASKKLRKFIKGLTEKIQFMADETLKSSDPKTTDPVVQFVAGELESKPEHLIILKKQIAAEAIKQSVSSPSSAQEDKLDLSEKAKEKLQSEVHNTLDKGIARSVKEKARDYINPIVFTVCMSYIGFYLESGVTNRSDDDNSIIGWMPTILAAPFLFALVLASYAWCRSCGTDKAIEKEKTAALSRFFSPSSLSNVTDTSMDDTKERTAAGQYEPPAAEVAIGIGLA